MIYATMRKITPVDISYNVGRASGEEISVLMTRSVYDSGNVIDEKDLIRYQRQEQYYTWEEFTQKTGLKRYKIAI